MIIAATIPRGLHVSGCHNLTIIYPTFLHTTIFVMQSLYLLFWAISNITILISRLFYFFKLTQHISRNYILISKEEVGVECLAFVPHLWEVAHQTLGQRFFGRALQLHPQVSR
jgi:hypothetical protein